MAKYPQGWPVPGIEFYAEEQGPPLVVVKPYSATFRDPPLCPVCRVNHVSWWITSKGQHFDPYCAACGFESTDSYRADIDPVFRDQALRRAIVRSR